MYRYNLLHLDHFHKINILRLDNIGVWVIEVYPSLLCNEAYANVDLYIILKLGNFSLL